MPIMAGLCVRCYTAHMWHTWNITTAINLWCPLRDQFCKYTISVLYTQAKREHSVSFYIITSCMASYVFCVLSVTVLLCHLCKLMSFYNIESIVPE
jgi:hypothetical protein